jgi:hypothetical protein
MQDRLQRPRAPGSSRRVGAAAAAPAASLLEGAARCWAPLRKNRGDTREHVGLRSTEREQTVGDLVSAAYLGLNPGRKASVTEL